MANAAAWNNRPAQEREERLRVFHQSENVSLLICNYISFVIWYLFSCLILYLPCLVDLEVVCDISYFRLFVLI
jgi:hypothetical protein